MVSQSHPKEESYVDQTRIYGWSDCRWMLNQLPLWAPDPATRKKILVDNPARLYGF